MENGRPEDSVQATKEVARFELLEERAVVEKRSEVAGRVSVRREVERRSETVTVELLTEILVIEVASGVAGVRLGDELLPAGQTREIVIYREEAAVSKRAVVSEEVRLVKRTAIRQEQVDLELGREVLRFDGEGVQEVPLEGPALLGHSSAGRTPERNSLEREVES